MMRLGMKTIEIRFTAANDRLGDRTHLADVHISYCASSPRDNVDHHQHDWRRWLWRSSQLSFPSERMAADRIIYTILLVKYPS